LSDLLKQHTPLVKRIAYHMMIGLPASVDVRDLIQAGMIGLLDAVRLYDASYDRKFEIYAVQRIRGAMLDELRSCDNLARPHREKVKRGEIDDVPVLSLESMLDEGFDLVSNDDPLDRLIKKELVKKAVDYLDGLPDRQKAMMTQYYIDGLTMREISKSIGISETWACLQHKEILSNLQEHLS
jgi:RNA polymerase sigma factor for flagellar operon FliA